MKLRVRVPGSGETHRVATPEVCDIGTLRALLASRLLPPGTSPSSVRLSLNGRDELAAASESMPLQGAGICNGDLVYILATAGAPAPPASQPGGSQPASEELRRRRCLEAAQARAGDGESASAASAPPTRQPLDGDGDGDDTPMAEDEAEASTLPPPAQPAVPGVLRTVFAAVALPPRSLHPATALALALHAAALDAGFVDATPSVGDALSGSAAQFRYALTAGGPQAAWMRTSLVGGDVVAYGGLFTADDVLRVAVRISDHYAQLPLDSLPEALPFSQLPALWMAAKDGLAAPLLRWACVAAGLVPPQPSLVSLPENVKFHILAMLPPKALAAAACVCKDLRFAASDETLWRAAYLAQFGQTSGGHGAVVAARGWRVAFGAAWRAKAQAERRAAMAADMRRRPRPHIFPSPGWPQPPVPGFPGQVPGIIGGDYDLHPGGRGGGVGFGFRGGQGMFGMGGGHPLLPFGGLPHPHHHPGSGSGSGHLGLFRSADDDATPY